nr:outer spore coat protein CotE [Bacilli bacterium]
MAFKEIVTKAIIGKGKKYFKNNYEIEPEIVPTTILGCWVINHNFKGYKKGSEVGVDGSYDVNVWYSYDNDSKTGVATKTINYNENFNVKLKENAELNRDTDIIVRSLKQPNVSKVDIKDNKIVFDVEKELGVEIVGDTKVKINIYDDEEPWDVIEDDYTEQVDKEIDSINEEYL